MELDAFSGSRLGESPFDLNDDDEFDEDDKVILIGSGGPDDEDKRVAASGLKSTEGILPTPAVLAAGTTEIKYSSGASGGIFTTTENPGESSQGRQAWRQFN
jgi:type IV pilus assembly protein PilY1